MMRLGHPGRQLAAALAVACVALLAPGGALADQEGSADADPAAGRIAAGGSSSCAIGAEGVVCWGDDGNGQAGNGPGIAGDVATPVAVPMPGGAAPQALAVGSAHACALLDGGRVACWGSDGFGQVGNGPGIGDVTAAVEITLPGAQAAVQVTAGFAHTCALLASGRVACWGSDALGQVGNGAITGDVQIPVEIALPSDQRARAIAGGLGHTCAILTSGQVACWGDDTTGQIGDGSATGGATAPRAISLPAGRTATAIAAGAFHTCVALNGTGLACWGDDSREQLGRGQNPVDRVQPAALDAYAGVGVRALAAGDFHTCFLSTSAVLRCWGDNRSGQVGANTLTTPVANPTVVTPASGVVRAVSAGAAHTCAILSAGSAACWGDDQRGQVGNGILAGPVFSAAADAAAVSGLVPRLESNIAVSLTAASPNPAKPARDIATTLSLLSNGSGPARAGVVTLPPGFEPARMPTGARLVSAAGLQALALPDLPTATRLDVPLVGRIAAPGVAELRATLVSVSPASPDTQPADNSAAVGVEVRAVDELAPLVALLDSRVTIAGGRRTVVVRGIVRDRGEVASGVRSVTVQITTGRPLGSQKYCQWVTPIGEVRDVACVESERSRAPRIRATIDGTRWTVRLPRLVPARAAGVWRLNIVATDNAGNDRPTRHRVRIRRDGQVTPI